MSDDDEAQRLQRKREIERARDVQERLSEMIEHVDPGEACAAALSVAAEQGVRAGVSADQLSDMVDVAHRFTRVSGRRATLVMPKDDEPAGPN